MEKNIITTKVFETLDDASIVFTKEDFLKNLNQNLKQQKIIMHKNSANQLIKQLFTKDYLQQQENFIVKTDKSLQRQSSKQCQLLLLLIQEFSKEFDLDYIKDQFIKHTLSQEQTPKHFIGLVEGSFDNLIQCLNHNKKITHKDNLNQIELVN